MSEYQKELTSTHQRRVIWQPAVHPHCGTDPVRSSQILEWIPTGRWGAPNDVAGAFW
jgi:hypothetical protein